MRQNNVKLNCLSRWGQKDEKIEIFNNNYDNWVNQFPPDYRNICFQLLDKFEYYSNKSIIKNLEKIHQILTSNFDVNYEEDSILTMVKSRDGRSNSSYEYVSEYKIINNITKNSWIDDINKIDYDDWDNINKIVLIDDCSGSGKTFIKYLQDNNHRFHNKKVIFVVIHLMKLAEEEITNYAVENGLDVVILPIRVRDKAFSEYVFNKDDIEESKLHTINVSKQFGITGNQILGFEDSQALMAFYNGSPNNTIGLFVKETNKYKAIFPRSYDKQPKWKTLNRHKKKRKEQNYIVKSQVNND